MTIQPRSTPRRATNKAGVILANGKEHTVVLRNASASGARLRLVRNAELPDRFRLSAPMEKIDADCHLVWRRGNDIGVKFD